MIAIFILTWILTLTGFAPAAALWAWFGSHILLTILLLLFLA